MKIYNIIFKFFSVAVICLLFTACSEDVMDGINKDINNPIDADSKFIITDLITRTAHTNMGGDLNTYLASYVEHEVGIHNQLYRAEYRQNEPSASATFNNSWVSLYRSLKDARIVIEKCSEGGSQAGNYVTRGMGKVMGAYNSALIADMFGDAPYDEAARRDESGLPVYMTPKVDTQSSIYEEVFSLLDSAIADLEKKDEHLSGSVGSNDLMYRGDKERWKEFAYGLKARYTMRLLHRSSNPVLDLEKVIEYVDKSFTSATDQAAFTIYDETNINPLFDFQWSRDALAASESMSEKLIERNDPRLRRVFINADWEQITGEDDEEFFMAPNGDPDQIQSYYNTSVFVFSQTAPTLLLSYHELLFLKAEALCRLGGRDNEAEEVLKEAIIAAIANTEIAVKAAMEASYVLAYDGLEETTDAISSTEAITYFENNVKPLFSSNPLKETMVQKYISFFGASGESTECYNDIRRMQALGENFVTLKNTNPFPLRLPYGNSDTTSNPNVKEIYGNGQYVYTENVWWAGGTR